MSDLPRPLFSTLGLNKTICFCSSTSDSLTTLLAYPTMTGIQSSRTNHLAPGDLSPDLGFCMHLFRRRLLHALDADTSAVVRVVTIMRMTTSPCLKLSFAACTCIDCPSSSHHDSNGLQSTAGMHAAASLQMRIIPWTVISRPRKQIIRTCLLTYTVNVVLHIQMMTLFDSYTDGRCEDPVEHW